MRVEIWRSKEYVGTWQIDPADAKKYSIVHANQIHPGGDRAAFAIADPSPELWTQIRKSKEFTPKKAN